jgi:hypothetical protein
VASAARLSKTPRRWQSGGAAVLSAVAFVDRLRFLRKPVSEVQFYG